MKKKYKNKIDNLRQRVDNTAHLPSHKHRTSLPLTESKPKPTVPVLPLNNEEAEHDISHQPFAARMELFKGLDINNSARTSSKGGVKNEEKSKEEIKNCVK